MFVLVIALLFATIVANPNFGDPGVVIRFIGRTAPIAIAAIGQYYVIVSGEFDLSMGAVIATQVVMAGNLIGEDDGRILPVMVLMLLVGAAIGLVNGLVTTLLRVPSFIVTLGMMLALAGLVRYLTGGAATGNPHETLPPDRPRRHRGRARRRGHPLPADHPAVLCVASGLADASPVRPHPDRRRRQPGGRAGRPARRVWWLKTRAFMLSSLSATVAGILLVGYAGVHPSSARATSSPRSPPSCSAASSSAAAAAGCSPPRPAPSRWSCSSPC